jgi:HNH endonuclease/AP2 domain
VAFILIKKKNKDVIITIIDKKNLSKAAEFPNTWSTYEINGSNYVVGHQKGKTTRLHRLLMDEPLGMVIDHINGNTLDNREENLRVIKQKENLQNQKGAHSNNRTSGIRGVCWNKKDQRWRAQCNVNKKGYFLGNFKTKEEAAEVVKEFRKKNMPYSIN